MLPQGEERWMMVCTTENLEAARKSLQKKANKDQDIWEKRLWHLSAQSFACEVDAEGAWEKTIAKLPIWLQASRRVVRSRTMAKRDVPVPRQNPCG
jgi:hypothetical protein